MAADPPPTDPASHGATTPSVALGPQFSAMAFAPGRFATAIQRTRQGTHEVQVLAEDSTASFTGQPEGSHEGEPTAIVALPPTAPLGTDAWEHSF